jgi:hypothetical protein
MPGNRMPPEDHSRPASGKPMPPTDGKTNHQIIAAPFASRSKQRLKLPRRYSRSLNAPSGSGLLPVWMSPSPLSGPARNWTRGHADVFVPSDVDGDGQAEIVIYKNDVDASNGLWTGVLKWQGGVLEPVWVDTTGTLMGPASGWIRGPADVFVSADVDGDGQAEIVIYNNNVDAYDDLWTGVLKWQGGVLEPVWVNTSGTLTGPAGDWVREEHDWAFGFINADIDGDSQQEVVVYNELTNWTAVLKWQGGALEPVWMNTSGILTGPVEDWFRAGDDHFLAADVDGDNQTEIIVYGDAVAWTGVLKWQDGALQPVWVNTSGTLTAPDGQVWTRDAGADWFAAGDLDGDRQQEVVIDNILEGWTGGLKWQGGALQPVWVNTSGTLTGPAGDWNRGDVDNFLPADVDGDRHVEVVIWAAKDYGDTGLLNWQNGGVQLIWKKGYPLSGPGGDWDRGPDDVFITADVDGDLQQEIVIYNVSDLWTGVLKWNP